MAGRRERKSIFILSNFSLLTFLPTAGSAVVGVQKGFVSEVHQQQKELANNM